MSERTEIKAYVVALAKTITPKPNVSEIFRTFDQVPENEMPLLQVISGDDEISTLRMQKVMLDIWDVDIWIYTQKAEDLETWITIVRNKFKIDRTLGHHCEDFALAKIQSTDEQFVTKRGVAKMIYKAKFRVTD